MKIKTYAYSVHSHTRWTFRSLAGGSCAIKYPSNKATNDTEQPAALEVRSSSQAGGPSEACHTLSIGRPLSCCGKHGGQSSTRTLTATNRQFVGRVQSTLVLVDGFFLLPLVIAVAHLDCHPGWKNDLPRARRSSSLCVCVTLCICSGYSLLVCVRAAECLLDVVVTHGSSGRLNVRRLRQCWLSLLRPFLYLCAIDCFGSSDGGTGLCVSHRLITRWVEVLYIYIWYPLWNGFWPLLE